MKTLADVKNDIAKEMQFIKDNDGSFEPKIKKELKKSRKRIQWLDKMRIYMEGNPSEGSVKKQLRKLTHELEVLNLRKPDDKLHPNKDKLRKALAAYNKEHEIPKKRKQLEHLNYLLQ